MDPTVFKRVPGFPASVTHGRCNCPVSFQTEWVKLTHTLQVTECELKTYKSLYHEAIKHISKANLAKVKLDKISKTLKESLDEIGLLLNFDELETPVTTESQNDLNRTFNIQQGVCLHNSGTKPTELEKDCENNDEIANALLKTKSGLHFENAKSKRSTLKQKKANEGSALPQKRSTSRKRPVSKDEKPIEVMEITSDVEMNADIHLEQQNLILIPPSDSQMNAKKSSINPMSVKKRPAKGSRKSKNALDRTSPKIGSLPLKVRKIRETLITERSPACDANEKIIDVTKKIVPDVLKEVVMNKAIFLTDDSDAVKMDELLISKCKIKNTRASAKGSRKSKNARDQTSVKISSLPLKVRKISETLITERSPAGDANEKIIDVTKKIPPNILKEVIMNKANVLTDDSDAVKIDELLISKRKIKNMRANALACGNIRAKNQKEPRKKKNKVYDPLDDMPSLDVLSTGYKRKKV